MTGKHNRNRFWIVLIAISMAFAIAMPAGAAPKKCEIDPTAPGCETAVDDEPLAGTTCNAIGEWDNLPISEDFTVTLTENACIDVIATEGDWTVDVEEIGDGKLRSLSLVIRDSVSPGDACDSVSYNRYIIPGDITLDGFESDGNPGIAGAWVNSCGTDWAELVEGDYYADAMPKIESPLVLQVFMSGKDAAVKLDVTLP